MNFTDEEISEYTLELRQHAYDLDQAQHDANEWDESSECMYRSNRYLNLHICAGIL
jgi:hypothetical protein